MKLDEEQARKSQALAHKIQVFLDGSGETYDDRIRMLLKALFQNAFEPGKAPWIIAELRGVIGMIRAMVLDEPCGTGFFTEAEIEQARRDSSISEVEEITSPDQIKIAVDVFAGTDHAAGPGKTLHNIWYRK